MSTATPHQEAHAAHAPRGASYRGERLERGAVRVLRRNGGELLEHRLRGRRAHVEVPRQGRAERHRRETLVRAPRLQRTYREREHTGSEAVMGTGSEPLKPEVRSRNRK